MYYFGNSIICNSLQRPNKNTCTNQILVILANNAPTRSTSTKIIFYVKLFKSNNFLIRWNTVKCLYYRIFYITLEIIKMKHYYCRNKNDKIVFITVIDYFWISVYLKVCIITYIQNFFIERVVFIHKYSTVYKFLQQRTRFQ